MNKTIEMNLIMNEQNETAAKESVEGFFQKLSETKTVATLENILWLAVGFVLAFFMMQAALSPFYSVERIEGNSMNPTMGNHAVLLVEKNLDDLTYGSIISTTKEFADSVKAEESGGFVKRVIGMPGDTITIKDNVFYLNGEVLVEPYIRDVTAIRNQDQTIVVPEGALFLMGDNRNQSFDSRHYGAVPLMHIDGIVKAQLSPLTAIHHFE